MGGGGYLAGGRVFRLEGQKWECLGMRELVSCAQAVETGGGGWSEGETWLCGCDALVDEVGVFWVEFAGDGLSAELYGHHGGGA